MKSLVFLFALVGGCSATLATDYHVSPAGCDTNPGTAAKPLQTISAAAKLAQPGDSVIVHAGTYRERIDPPRGGTSDARRITYRAAKGETIVVKGSEIVKGWVKVRGDTWKADVPNSLFGEFNPYTDRVRGDWFTPRNKSRYHTGQVYLNGTWLKETASKAAVLKPAGATALWYTPDVRAASTKAYLFNVGSFKTAAASINAAKYASAKGAKSAPAGEGKTCLGFIRHNDCAIYENVDFGKTTDAMEFRVASPSLGGVIEVRDGSAKGALLGRGVVRVTGDWQTWQTLRVAIKPTSGKKTICLVFKAAAPAESDSTTIYAQFKGVDPNKECVEINVRQSVFYPLKTGINYITVRGFTMEHAATNWAPPTAEQVGAIGTNWSKGWVIEDNTIRYSTCVGITLGKHGDRWDNTSANSAEGYVKTIERAAARGWSKENIGHHIVRNNHVSHCEQAGIVGSLGAIFSTVTGNTIHEINMRGMFGGAEMAGIKFHAAIDTLIANNRIYRCCRGIWLDWMTQGTRVTGNLLYRNGPREDLFVEVNHGPFVVDNNIFLSRVSVKDASQGGAYINNLFAGTISHRTEKRQTPYHPAHSTTVAGLHTIRGGSNRYINNLFVGSTGLTGHSASVIPTHATGNVYLSTAKPCKTDTNALLLPSAQPALKLAEDNGRVVLEMTLSGLAPTTAREIVTGKLLGTAKIPNVPFADYDGSKLTLNRDYFGKMRKPAPAAGPFTSPGQGKLRLTVWPKRW